MSNNGKKFVEENYNRDLHIEILDNLFENLKVIPKVKFSNTLYPKSNHPKLEMIQIFGNIV